MFNAQFSMMLESFAHCSLIIVNCSLFLRVSIRMALHAVAKFHQALSQVRRLIFFRIVGVAVVARVVRIDFYVTDRARNFAFVAVIDREGVLGQSGGQPALDGVAGGAIRPK